MPKDQPPSVNQPPSTAEPPPPVAPWAASDRAIGDAEFAMTLAVLQRIAADRGLLVRFDSEQQNRLLQLAGQVAHPGRAAKRQLNRANRAQRRAEVASQKQRDEQRLEHTGIRQLQRISARRLGAGQPPAPTSEVPRPPDESHVDPAHLVQRLEVARNCYICKRDFDRLHFFYDSMCPACAEFNWNKRNQSADLNGRVALLTGGRVKIGFEAALKLLRSGAQVVVTTRFPRDAACRFGAQADSPKWLERLRVYGLDMRHTPSVEALAEHLLGTLPRLDFIVNNACQTVRRPPAYYQHLLAEERHLEDSLPPQVAAVLAPYRRLLSETPGAASLASASVEKSTLATLIDNSLSGIQRSAELSQVALLHEDRGQDQDAFPPGAYDRELQQVDMREKNSWRLKLAEVATVELLEVHLVNAVAPFIFNARLKPLMVRVATRDKHIVNVSAMEGVFYRAFKRDTHPHTNMAKAALNMLTRTSAADYIQDGIHMNSVDTGWITDEDPLAVTVRKREQHGFSTPLDTIDAAARICDPIFAGFNSGVHVWGKFLKDYQVSNW